MFWSLPSSVFLCLFWCVWGDEHFSWVKTSKGVHGKMFDGLVFLGGYQGLQYISYSKPSENSQCRNPPLPLAVAAAPGSSTFRRGTYDLHLRSTWGREGKGAPESAKVAFGIRGFVGEFQGGASHGFRVFLHSSTRGDNPYATRRRLQLASIF